MQFNGEKIQKLTEKLYDVAASFDSDCEISSSIEGVLHTERCEVVTQKLKIIIDFAPMEGGEAF